MLTILPSPRQEESLRPEHPRVTVVNDHPEFLSLMQDLLQDATYPSTLIDGDRGNALELIEASEPDLLIIDLRMMGDALHGMDVLRQVRQQPSLRQVPTLICTATKWGLEEIEHELAAFERTSLLTKPFTIAELYAAIEGLLPD